MDPMIRMFVIALLSLLLVPAAAQAEDPLEDVSGTEDWIRTPPARRQPAETRRQLRAHIELDDTAEELQTEQVWLQREQREFARDRAALERCRASGQARCAGARQPRKGADPASVRRAAGLAADQAFEASAAASTPARASKASPRPQSQLSADTAFDAAEERAPAAPAWAQPAERTAATPPSQEAATPARPSPEAELAERKRLEDEARRAAERDQADRRRLAEEQASQTEQRRLEEQAARAAEQAQAEQRRRAEEAARRLGGSLDESGQFIDPDLAGP